MCFPDVEPFALAAPPAAAMAPDSPPDLHEIFAAEYRRLRPRAPLPALHISFYAFARVNNTIRLRQGQVFARLSDALEHAPESVLHAIAHILLAKLYRKPVAERAAARFRQYVGSAPVSRHAERIRQLRGRKRNLGARGAVYDLEEIFTALNARFFQGLMAQPTLTWSAHRARRLLGHYDSAHNTIMVSRVFDHPQVPRFAIEYLLYHEMLHLKHPVRVKAGRRCVHSREFQAEERLFPQHDEAREYLKRL
jgi:predicted metal-dependent hydrolase